MGYNKTYTSVKILLKPWVVILTVIYWLWYIDCDILTVIYWLWYIGCDILTVIYWLWYIDCDILTPIYWLRYIDSDILTPIYWLWYIDSEILTVIYWLWYIDCDILTVIYWLWYMVRVAWRSEMKLKLKLIHNNATLGLDWVKNWKVCMYIYTGWSKSICASHSLYSSNPHIIDDLKMAITEYMRNVDRVILNTVFENTVRRVNKCLEIGGGHFEHYL